MCWVDTPVTFGSSLGLVVVHAAHTAHDVYCDLDHDAKVRGARDARQFACVLEVSWQKG
jgi:hypothetical protein